MNLRILLPSAAILWVGLTLVLSRLRWFSRRSLVDRLRPYQPGPAARSRRGELLSVESFRGVIAPIASEVGGRVARLFGVEEDLATRLHRIHSPLDPVGFRVRQLGWAVGAFGVAALSGLALRIPPVLALLAVVGAPLLAFLVIEQQLASASANWQQRLFLELPVVCEQVGMLLSAGHSLGGALSRITARGQGACVRDLRRVNNRVRQGLTETDALREWADLAAIPEVRQVVHVLSLNRATSDLGRLMSREARSIRQEVQRRRVELLDKRTQQVWIPVTVATLIPGVIFLAVPFLQAMRLFTTS